MQYCTFLFLLFTLLIKSSTAHIDVQTQPPVLAVRCLCPVHINMICALSVPSQHHLIRTVTAFGLVGAAAAAVGGVTTAQEDLSVGILMKL